ncbi:MAG: propionate catabolism operon regulatory protein PrpR [Spiribacter salinus]|uniref:Propionate catabolism operon regulatory protein PrpR n=1 Tax=Spiribacter salinus TaxID=1335746 RepID=A0A540VV50_9GAMM|nr:MAG: propionate catabolism operon regulatory protein PrpR [Spiribacter salinus]
MRVSTKPHRRARIAVISYRGLSQLVGSLISEYRERADITIIDKVFDDAIQIATELVRSGQVDVILSAGANGAYLADTLGIPVVRIPVTGADVMRALLIARKMSDHIAVVTYQQPNSELEEIKDLVNLDIEQRTYTTIDNAKETFRELADRGFRVIVGSSLITELAKHEGLTGILVYSRNSVRSTIEDALEIALIRYTEEQRADRINTILSHLNEGVVAVDANQKIQLANPALESLTGLTCESIRGKRLEDLMPDLTVSEVFRHGQAYLGRVEKINKRTVVTNRIPIRTAGDITGAVLTIQDAQAISRADRSIRSRNRRTKFTAKYQFDDIIGQSPSLLHARRVCEQYAETDATVLVTGETGTGKELFVQGIHNASRRRNAPFVAVNCGAIPDNLLESELFGYEEGAFTGSRRGGQTGLFELAHTGTICLDEVGEMPLLLQTRLLRVLQEKVVMPLGGDPVPIDVRVVAATNCNLKKAVEEGTFRRDLYYRLNILQINLPALHERGDDVLLLAAKLLRDKLGTLAEHRDVVKLVDKLAPYLTEHNWPGNVRELENIIERLAVLWAESEDFLKHHIERSLRTIVPEFFSAAVTPPPEDADSLKGFVERTEVQRIRNAVQACHGNISEAARTLKLSRTTVWRKLRRYEKDGETTAGE